MSFVGKKYGIIDVGSNTVRLGIYKCINDEYPVQLDVLVDQVIHSQLYQYVNNRIMSNRGINAAADAINSLINLAMNLQCDNIYIIATAVIRNIDNREEVCTEIENKTHMSIQVLSEYQEALFGMLGISDYISSNSIILDVGGGSSEVTINKNGNIEKTFSIPWGALRLYIENVSGDIPTRKELYVIQKTIETELGHYTSPTSIDDIYIIGGNIGAVKKVLRNITLESGIVELSPRVMNILTNVLINSSDITYPMLCSYVPERSNTVIPAMIIYNTVMKYFGIKNIYTPEGGIKEGFLKNLIRSENHKE